MVEVSKEEFDEFIENYPRKLEINSTTVCEPILVSYNDFTLGDFPDSIVASYFRNTESPEIGKITQYRILKDNKEKEEEK